jgi:hypothetical protein
MADHLFGGAFDEPAAAAASSGDDHLFGGAFAPADEPAPEIGNGRAVGVSFLRGVPIAGAYADQVTAALNAAASPFIDTPGMSKKAAFQERYEENKKRIKSGVDKWSEEHSGEAALDQFLGGTAATAPVAATSVGARALGLAGKSLASRAVTGGATGVGLNALDAGLRDGSPGQVGASAAVGGLIGGGVPLAGRAAGMAVNKLLSPATDTATSYLLKKAEQYGVPIRPAQISTSPFIQKTDQMLAQVPGSGMSRAVGEQRAGFSRAVANTFGEDATALTPDIMDAAKKRIGAEFDAVEKGTTVRFDRPLVQKLGDIVKDASDVLESDQVAPIAKRVTAIADLSNGGDIEGRAFNNLMKKGAPLSRLQKSSDPNVAYYAGQIRSAMQDALERSAPSDLAQRYNKARLQYRNMKTVEPLIDASGDVSPLRLAAKVKQANPNFAYGAGGDLADLARIGQRFMRQPPDSGTPAGQKVLNVFYHGAPALAGAALGTNAYQNGGDPLADIGLGVGGVLATAMAARGASRFLARPQMLENALTRLPAYSPQVRNLLLENQNNQ